MALGQVNRHLDLMERFPTPPVGDDIHWWQRLNPVVTEVLTQLVGGAPQMLYNGGLPLARVRWADARRGRPGLPEDVAALVEEVGPRHTVVNLVNLGAEEREVRVVGGMYGELPVTAVSFDEFEGDYPGESRRISPPEGTSAPRHEAVADDLCVRLPARTRIRLRLEHDRAAPRHQDLHRGTE